MFHRPAGDTQLREVNVPGQKQVLDLRNKKLRRVEQASVFVIKVTASSLAPLCFRVLLFRAEKKEPCKHVEVGGGTETTTTVRWYYDTLTHGTLVPSAGRWGEKHPLADDKNAPRQQQQENDEPRARNNSPSDQSGAESVP